MENSEDNAADVEDRFPVGDADRLWGTLAGYLRAQVSEAVWLTSFHDVRPLRLDEHELVLGVESSLLKERFESRHLTAVRDALDSMGSPGVEVSVEVVADGHAFDPAPVELAPIAPVRTTATGAQARSAPVTTPTNDFNPRYTFDAFVTGASNRFAHAAALAVAETPARSYNPLFIHGGAGLGKTHLLHAIAHYVEQNYPDHQIRYVSTETFLNEYVEAIRTNTTAGFKRRYRDIDLLLVDDIQFMEGKEGLQEEFFHTFNSLHGAGRQIVISSDRPPKNIATLEDRLRSRFEWGLITDIQPPDLETRLAILRKKSEADRTPVPAQVLEFIASNITNNIRELEGALIRVSAFASLNDEPLTLDLARRVLGDIVTETEPRTITVASIIEQTAAMFGFSVEELRSKQRHRALVTARQVAMYVARELTDYSYPQIAREFGGRDHTTVMYAFDKISKQMAERRQIYEQVTALIQQIKSA